MGKIFFQRLFRIAVVLLCIVTAATILFVKNHTINYSEIERTAGNGNSVTFDSNGIPTLQARDWHSLLELQGYIVASERLWQMDLMRRAGSGELAEWFGHAALERDIERRSEDWQGIAEQATRTMPTNELAACTAFAHGVNRYIAEHSDKWGIEYAMLRVAPEPWHCSDSVLVMMGLAYGLTNNAEREARENTWRTALPPDWTEFLFTDNHPWNHPLFGTAGTIQPPKPENFLPSAPLEAPKQAQLEPPADWMIGSNSWAWRGPTGIFLANDPHIEFRVPQVWYAMRLRVSASEWVVGVALPGLPGIVIGMNAHLAWSFTNVGEDVDDYLKETLNADGSKYIARIDNGDPQWQPVRTKPVTIRVKGAPDYHFTATFTHRGPLAKRPTLGNEYYSRQYLLLHPEYIQIPTLELDRARNWEEFNDACDHMTVPAQNATYVDYSGNIGYRTTGTGVFRRVTGQIPQPANEGEWIGFEPVSQRHRLFIQAHGQPLETAQLATANERIWTGSYSQHWYSEDRKDRIRQVLSQKNEQTLGDMEALQLDTFSRFHQELLRWITVNAAAKNATQAALLQSWHDWNGIASSGVTEFTYATVAEQRLLVLLTERIKNKYFPAQNVSPYNYRLRRAWMVWLLDHNENFIQFGTTAKEVAQFLLDEAERNHDALTPYPERNRLQANHPFVGRVPLVGRFFTVRAFPQTGYEALVKVERPEFGASMRTVWDLSDPLKSTWSFPIGQSGHLASRHYRDLQPGFYRGDRLPVFDTKYTWNFGRR